MGEGGWEGERKGDWMGGERCTLLVCLECNGVVDAHCCCTGTSLGRSRCNSVRSCVRELKVNSVATNVLRRWCLRMMLFF